MLRRAAVALACAPAAVHSLVLWRGRSPLDRRWYAEQGWAPARGQLAHYLLVGRRAGWSPHPLLEPAWVAPSSYRQPWPEPLTAPDPERGTHPVVAAGVLTVHSAGSLGEDTLVPVVTGPRTAVAYGELRAAAFAAARLRAEHEALRLLPRVQAGWTPSAPALTSAASATPVKLPTVTVVMPVRDRPGQVARAIASVQAQTHRAWQLVVVDDGSSDSTPDVVAELAGQDDRIQLVRAEHGGVSAARNLGAAHAVGEVLAWLDSDNTWTPDYLRRMLSVLASTGAESAYAALEQHSSDGVRIRALDAGQAALQLQNHIDLNVLVARRAAVEAVGGFDPTLRRAVDYDLVLRLSTRARIPFVPIVGARYDERAEATDRITAREAKTWSDVVRVRRLVDWAALRDGLAARVADRVSVVVPLPRTVSLTGFVPTVLDALGRAAGDVEVVVVDAGGSRATGTALACLAAVDDRLRVLRWPVPMSPGWALAHALPHTTGALVAVLDPGCRLDQDYDAVLRSLGGSVVSDTGLLAVRANELIDVGGADPLESIDAWREELANRLVRTAGLRRRVARVVNVGPLGEPASAPAKRSWSGA